MTRSRPLLDAMVHPLMVGSVVLLVLNDHLLKSVWSSWTTGKLSDFAGLLFFPILMGAFIEVVAPTDVFKPRVVLAVSVALTGITFIGLQLSPLVGDGYQLVMGLVQWPFRLVLDPSSPMSGVALTPDPTDLITLPALLLAWRVGTRFSRLPERNEEIIHPTSAAS